MYNRRKWKSFISIILILTLILPDLLNGFKMIYASTKNTDNTIQEPITISKSFKNVAEGFKKVVVGITTPKEGYVAGGDLSAGFSMDITVDGDYLYSVYDQYKDTIGFPEFQDPNHEDESIDDYNNRVDEFFHNNEDMPVMSYDFNIGKDFSIDSVLLDKEMGIADEDGKELGKAIFSSSDEGLSVNVTFENQIYNRLDAQLGFEQVIEVKEECLKPEPVYVAWENDALIINTKEELEGD